jgi:hypothetical protein
MLKHIVVASTLCLTLSLSGCGEQERADAGSRPGAESGRQENPDALVRSAIESRTELSSIAGKGVMRIVDQPSKFGLTVNANVVADASENRLRIKADKLAGSVQAFDVVMLGDDIGFYIPTQNTLYHGKVGDLQNFSFNFDPDEVMRQMMTADASLIRRKWRHAKAGPGDPKTAIVLEEAGSRNRPYLRLALNPKNGTIYTITHMDASGEPVFVKKFDDYRDLASNGKRGDKLSADDTSFPYLISFIWPKDKRSMEMHFKQVEGNARVSDGDFDIAASETTRYLPLNQAESQEGDPMASAMPRAPADAERM